MKKHILISCSAVALSCVLLGGCMSDQTVATLTTGHNSSEPTLSTQTAELLSPEETAPLVQPGKAEQQPAGMPQTVQLRLPAMPEGWWSRFGTEGFLVAEEAGALESSLAKCALDAAGLDLKAYDEAFFREYYLAVLPRVSSSGSVRFEARLTGEGNGVCIRLEGKMPEAGTCDMADWLVLVPVPRNLAAQGSLIRVDPQGQPQGPSDTAER